jgi:hypothetical protein
MRGHLMTYRTRHAVDRHIPLHPTSCSTGCMQGYFGEQLGSEEQPGRHVGAVAPRGCWISQWRVGWGVAGTLDFIQGVLNDGTTLPPINWEDRCQENEVIGDAGGSFTALHGRWVSWPLLAATSSPAVVINSSPRLQSIMYIPCST